MHVHEDQLYYGAGVIQVAEDRHFTAINAFKYRGKNSRCAFVVNDDIGLYMKYCSHPVGKNEEYQFGFDLDNLKELERLSKRTGNVFVGLVCVEKREICCLSYACLLEMIAERKKAKGADENRYIILASLPTRGRFRVYLNAPRTKGMLIGEKIIPRNAFPSLLFDAK